MYKNNKISFSHKLIVCLLTGILTSYILRRFNPAYLPGWLPKIFISLFFWSFLLAPILFIPIWQMREKRNKIDSVATLGFFQAVLIYFLAFDFTKWALLKFLHLHMTTSLGWMEMPMTMLSGEQQGSHFFGQNYPMVVALGIFELSGAILILFRKTRLSGALILFVMSANIVLLDLMYGVKGPLPEACLLLCVVTYIALQDFDKIINFFFRASNRLPKFNFKSNLLKNALRISAIIIPALVLIPHYKAQYRPNLTGKYKILKMTVNGKERLPDSCDNNTFSNVYFDLGDYFAFTSSDFNKIQVGSFEFDEATRQLKTVWRYPKGFNDTLFAKVSALDKENKMNLSGIMGKDTVRIVLLKKEVKSVTKTY
ncbi:MAG: hypothetical protein JWM28_591 [Chitinophagaceae bacterium]|nr:hypothetical protein [Chitinophagaceae bacterium]